jgi:hypothetical protein
MTRDAFLQSMQNYGVSLWLIHIYVNEVVKSNFATYILQEKDEWVIYEVDERNKEQEVFQGNEEEAFEELFEIALYRLSGSSFTNPYITMEILTMTYKECESILRCRFGKTRLEARKLWNDLCEDFWVLSEFKYYLRYQTFLPPEYAVRRFGKTARDFYQFFFVYELEAFRKLARNKE